MSLKSQIHAVLAKQGGNVAMTDLLGVAGRQLLDEVNLDTAYRLRVDSLRELIVVFDGDVNRFDGEIRDRLADDPCGSAGHREQVGDRRPRGRLDLTLLSRAMRHLPHRTSSW